MAAHPAQRTADEQFVRDVEAAKAAGMRSWAEIAAHLGFKEITAFFTRRRRVERRLDVLIPSPTGKVAGNAKPQTTHAARPIDVRLLESGDTLTGLKARGTSTLFDADGNPRLQWVKTTRDQQALDAYYRALGEALAAEVPRVKPVAAGRDGALPDLMACYPIGDAHIGMLSWGTETGEDWDLRIAEQTQCAAMRALVDSAPPAKFATIVNLGDWLHYDSMAAVTPASGHNLDADSRYGKVIRVAIAVMRTCIDAALRKHTAVRVINAIGNHDETGALWLAQALAAAYEREPRVTVDTSPAVYNYFEHGRCLVGIHHGHKTRVERLPGVMAADQPEAWGRTRHRYWWLGHVHHQRVIEAAGVVLESFNTLAAKDAYAHGGGWRARRQMQCIVLHREHGEVARSTVTAAMVAPADGRRKRAA